jgi:hypothetical protein
LGKALQCLFPQQTTDEIAGDKTLGHCAQDNGIRFGKSLEPRGNIGRLTQGQLFVSAAATNLANNDESGVNADPRVERTLRELREPVEVKALLP